MDVMTKADLRKLVDELPEEALNGEPPSFSGVYCGAK
jgi:hypothetical protein